MATRCGAAYCILVSWTDKRGQALTSQHSAASNVPFCRNLLTQKTAKGRVLSTIVAPYMDAHAVANDIGSTMCVQSAIGA